MRWQHWNRIHVQFALHTHTNKHALTLLCSNIRVQCTCVRSVDCALSVSALTLCVTHTVASHSYDFSIYACYHRTTETPIRILFLFIHCFQLIYRLRHNCVFWTEPSNLWTICDCCKRQNPKTNTDKQSTNRYRFVQFFQLLHKQHIEKRSFFDWTIFISNQLALEKDYLPFSIYLSLSLSETLSETRRLSKTRVVTFLSVITTHIRRHETIWFCFEYEI